MSSTQHSTLGKQYLTSKNTMKMCSQIESEQDHQKSKRDGEVLQKFSMGSKDLA